MMKKFLCATLLSTCMAFTHGGVFSPAPVAYAQEATAPVKIDHLAILDFEAKGGMSKDEASIITERFRAQLLRSGRFRIMERAKMQEILKEQGFQESGLCDNTECSVELGRLLSVNRILTGSVNKFGNIYSLSARIMDVEKGNIVIEEYEDCKCELDDLLTQTTAALVAKLTGESTILAQQGSVEIKSEPPGAEVFWNGQSQGVTPLTLKDQKHGNYTLKLVFNGYQEYQQEVKVNTSSQQLNIPLTQVDNSGWIWGIVIGSLLVVGGVVGFIFLQGGSTTETGGEVVVRW